MQQKYYPYSVCVFGLFLFVALSAMWPAETMASHEWGSRVSAQLIYDDNLNFSCNNEKRDWIYDVRPSLFWKYYTERDLFDVAAALHGQRYDTERGLDTLDQDYRINASRDILWNTTLSLNARYTLDTTLDDEFEEEGVVLDRNDRIAYSMTPAIEWRATERSNWSLSAPVYHVNYEGDENTDYNTAYLVLNYSLLLDDEKTSVFAQANAGTIDYENGNARTCQIMLGAGRAFTERLFAKLMGGMSYTRSHRDEIWMPIFDNYQIRVQEEETSHNTGWVGEAEIKWKWDRGHWDMRLGRTVSASGYGEMLIRDRLTLGTSYSITERTRFAGRFSITSSESEGDETDRDELTYGINPGIIYRLSERIDLGAYYRYSFLDDKDTSDTATRNRFLIRLDCKNLRFGL